jgi:nitroreductase
MTNREESTPESGSRGGARSSHAADFPVERIDELLSTTRTVRRRLDLDRDVPDDILLECIDLAEQAPTGGNQASRRWLVVSDPAIKAELAGIYRRAAGDWMIERARQLGGTGHRNEKTMASSAHLARNLERVPKLVVVSIIGVHDGSGRPGLFDSVIQAAWSFCLALRARGLGSAWTTAWLNEKDAVAELLGIPDDVTPIVMLPVAWTLGTGFGPAPRRPAAEITWFDAWGFTSEVPRDGEDRLANGPGVTVEVDIGARPAEVWPVVTDIGFPAEFSSEFDGAEWLDEPGPGARFRGHNSLPGREWETESHVVVWEPETRFGWNVRDVDDPGARWLFELEPLAGGTRLRFSVRLGPGPSGLRDLIRSDPEHEAEILHRRRLHHRENMARTLEGIRQRVEVGH